MGMFNSFMDGARALFGIQRDNSCNDSMSYSDAEKNAERAAENGQIATEKECERVANDKIEEEVNGSSNDSTSSDPNSSSYNDSTSADPNSSSINDNTSSNPNSSSSNDSSSTDSGNSSSSSDSFGSWLFSGWDSSSSSSSSDFGGGNGVD